jgi:uncharacterized protein (DUF58 family)
MLINRVLMVVFIIASAVFASCYGGNVSYALFYMSLSLPVISVLYTFYVYIRFRIYQEIGQRMVVKGDFVPYSFTLANEDYITFRSIKVNFLHDKSTIVNVDDIKEYCLLPGQSEKMETYLRCNYRGEYYVGASSVDIIDFLYLFKITYPISSKLKVTVLPRVVNIPRLSIAPAVKDVKNTSYLSDQVLDTMDLETRKYMAGDSKKQIHWKISAKRGQLFSRKFTSNPREEMVIFMDLSPVQADELTSVIAEDQIIEGTLSIANYCRKNNIGVRICYQQAGLKSIYIGSKTDFDYFYRLTCQIHFNATVPVEKLLKDSQVYMESSGFCIVITHKITFELFKIMTGLAENGYELSLLLICDALGEEEEELIKSLKLSGILVKQVTREDEIGEVLKA